MTHARVVPERTKKYKLTVTVQRGADNEMGQIDQISIDQVKARQRLWEEQICGCMCRSEAAAGVTTGSVNHLHLHDRKTGITGWEENYIGQLPAKVWLHIDQWAPPLSLMEPFFPLSSDLSHTAKGSPTQTPACLCGWMKNGIIDGHDNATSAKKKGNFDLCTEVISYH